MENALIAIAAACAGLSAVLVLALLLRHGTLLRRADELVSELRSVLGRIEVLQSQVGDFERDLKQDLALARVEQANASGALRTELGARLHDAALQSQQEFAANRSAQGDQIRAFGDAFGERLAQLQQSVQAQLAAAASAQAVQVKQLTDSLGPFQQAVDARLAGSADAQARQLATFGTRLAELTTASEQRLEAIRMALEQRLDALRDDNSRKLEAMRQTVDEKLQATLEQRLGTSFRQVSEQLEQVYRGLGEMQQLASGVGDLKRVLTNVKSRGIWGEVQLATLLAEALTPQQYAANVETIPGTNRRVEFAIRLPGKSDDGPPCWLPIDCKFPLEDWQRLHEALERADPIAAEEARKSLMDFLRQQAKMVRDLYVASPFTTDFAILFVPTEGLYAEIMARPGFAEMLQRDYRVVVTGPTNFLALLNSLQMGFRTLAIEQRSSEVWKVLGAVKTDFVKFGDILQRTQKKLQEASNTIDEARSRSTTITRKLRSVEELPEVEALRLLGEAPGSGTAADPAEPGG